MSPTFLVPGVVAGLLLGLVSILLSKGNLGYGTHEIIGLLAMAIATASAQLTALRGARNNSPQIVAFAPRYFLAMLTGAVTSITFGLVSWLHYAVIDREFLARFYLQYTERAKAAAASPEEAQQLLAAAEQMKDFITDPFSQAMVQFGTALMISLLTGLLVTALMRPRD
ncbi:MAG TPA: DUF4199 domain-containing protein [Gammaproteobacteria bacterium]